MLDLPQKIKKHANRAGAGAGAGRCFVVSLKEIDGSERRACAKGSGPGRAGHTRTTVELVWKEIINLYSIGLINLDKDVLLAKRVIWFQIINVL